MRSKISSDLTNKDQLGRNGKGSIPSIYTKSSSKVIGDSTAAALTTLGLVNKRLYLIPFQTAKQIKLSKIKISVTTANGNSSCTVGIYNNTTINNEDKPSELLVSSDVLLTTSTGDKECLTTFTFNPDTLYWIGVICTGAPTLRALGINSIFPLLGRVPNNTTCYTHFIRNLTNSILPPIAPTDGTISTGSIPAIYISE
jgi:hypothetical protein